MKLGRFNRCSPTGQGINSAPLNTLESMPMPPTMWVVNKVKEIREELSEGRQAARSKYCKMSEVWGKEECILVL